MALYTSSDLSHATATSDTLVKTGKGRLRYVFIEGNSGGGVWVIRDATAAGAGKVIGSFSVAAGAVSFEWPIQFDDGLYLDAGTSPGRICVLYE